MQSRNRSSNALNKKKQAFEIFTNRLSSKFKRVKMKMTNIQNENVISKMKNVVHRLNFASNRKQRKDNVLSQDIVSFQDIASSRNIASSRDLTLSHEQASSKK
jgi:hypothetical protein